MKIGQLLNVQPVIQQILDRKLPGKLAYGLAKNFRLISAELEDYDKARIKILQDHWILDPTTNKYNIPDDDQEKWKEMHGELLESESGYIPFKIDMALTEQAEWTPGELLNLWFIFDGNELAPPIAGARARVRSKKAAAAK